MSETVGKGKNWIEKMFGYKGFVKYIHNAELMITTLKPLAKIPYTITINKTERFVLLKPAETIFGKPCYWLLKGYPLSITCKMLQTTNPIIANESNNVEKLINTNIDYIKGFDSNEVLKKDIVKKEIDNMDIDLISSEQIKAWIDMYESKGSKAITGKSKKFTKGFSEFVKLQLKNTKEIQFDYNPKNIEALVLEKLVIPMFHTSQDFQTFTQSGYNRVALASKNITVNQALVYILSIALTGFITFTFTNWWHLSQNSVGGG